MFNYYFYLRNNRLDFVFKVNRRLKSLFNKLQINNCKKKKQDIIKIKNVNKITIITRNYLES